MTTWTRPSGRGADALRRVTLTRTYTRHAEGSVLVEFGDTKVLCTASVEPGVPVLDLDYPEDSACDTDMNVVMTASGGMIELQGTAEGAPFSRAELDTLLGLAERGIAQLIAAQKSVLAERR